MDTVCILMLDIMYPGRNVYWIYCVQDIKDRGYIVCCMDIYRVLNIMCIYMLGILCNGCIVY